PTSEPNPWIDIETMHYAGRVQAISVGRLTLGLYVKNPAGKPDAVVRFRNRLSRETFGDEERLSLTITRAGDFDLECRPKYEVDGTHFLALTDSHGNVILVDDLTKADADRVCELATLCPVCGSEAEEEPLW